MQQQAIVITAARRTPIGSFQGQFATVSAPDLAAAAIKAALTDTQLPAGDVSEVIIGCVLPAALGQAPARQAALAAGLPVSVGATTINKVCGSGAKAIMLANDLLLAGSAEVVIAGGMESMTRAPHMLPQARSGYRYGAGKLIDHMAFDGLENPSDGQAMGVFGDMCAAKFSFSREAQDAFAVESVNRAMAAAAQGAFESEITPVTVKTRKGETVITSDEEPPRCNVEKIPNLRPAFGRDGTVTAATASKISDGAAAVVMMSELEAQKRGLSPLATVVGHATHAQEPEWFTTAPVPAIKKLMDRIGWSVEDVDLFEINEAFAAVTMAAMHDLNLDHAKVNVNGGACALGHPIGATGTRLIVTLINALKARGLKRGIASQCIGGGESTAIAIELSE